MVLNLKESKVRRIAGMKWINIYILGVFHFSPPLTYGPVLNLSGPKFISVITSKAVDLFEGRWCITNHMSEYIV